MTQIPAGWYPDPAPAQPGQPPLVRYWDGAVWTEHVAPAAPGVAPGPGTQAITPAYGATSPVAASGPTTPDGERLAGWWWRVGAYVVDSLALGVVSQILMLPFTSDFNEDFGRLNDEWRAAEERGTLEGDRVLDDFVALLQDNMAAFAVPAVLSSLLYFVLFWRLLGASPGQLAFGLRVRLRERPGNVAWGTAVVRWLFMVGLGSLVYVAVFLSLPLALLLIGAVAVYSFVNGLWPTWDSKRQALHDKVARTNVVKVR